MSVEFEFKHRSRDAMDELLARVSAGELKDVDSLREILAGWELDDPFSEESIQKLIQNYQGAAPAIVRKYMAELTQARLGN
ncbi:Phage tail assembly chaperone [compost metagenome]